MPQRVFGMPCLLSRRTLWIFAADLPKFFALKSGGDLIGNFQWSPFARIKHKKASKNSSQIQSIFRYKICEETFREETILDSLLKGSFDKRIRIGLRFLCRSPPTFSTSKTPTCFCEN